MSRLPVRHGGEHVVGYVDLRDLVDADPESPVSAFLLPVVQSHGGHDAADLLAELQERQIELTVVSDELGAHEGLLTVEHLVEELVGEAFDVGEPRAVSRIGPNRASARGAADVAAVNELLGTDLQRVEGGSLAALVVPEVGASRPSASRSSPASG